LWKRHCHKLCLACSSELLCGQVFWQWFLCRGSELLLGGRPVGSRRSASGVPGGLLVSPQLSVMQLKTFANYPLFCLWCCLRAFSQLLALAKCCLHLEWCFKIDRRAQVVCCYFFTGRFLYMELLYRRGLDQAQKESTLTIYFFF